MVMYVSMFVFMGVYAKHITQLTPPFPNPFKQHQQEEEKPTGASFPAEPEALDAAAPLAPAVDDFGAVAPSGVGAPFGEPVASQWESAPAAVDAGAGASWEQPAGTSWSN